MKDNFFKRESKERDYTPGIRNIATGTNTQVNTGHKFINSPGKNRIINTGLNVNMNTKATDLYSKYVRK